MLRQGITAVAAGMALGIVIAIMLGQVTGHFLVGITGSDPVTYMAVTGMLAAVALAAIMVPAHRATRVNPSVALRTE